MYRWVRERHMIGIRGRNFMEAPWAGGIVLLGCVIIAMLLANLPATSLYYRHLLETDLSLMVHSPDGVIDWIFPRGMTVEKFINDGLMVIFFFAVGLEIKREIVCGQLSSARRAILPVLAAAGGRLVPAIFFTAFNHGTMAANGWGIPTATDIAFAIGPLSLLGNRVPVSLKIFLTALAVADDLGAILVIALFYVGKVQITCLLVALGIMLGVYFMKQMCEKLMFSYLVPAFVVWGLFYYSGVHSTISGVAPFWGPKTLAEPFGTDRGFVTSHSASLLTPLSKKNGLRAMWRLAPSVAPVGMKLRPLGAVKRTPSAAAMPQPASVVQLPPRVITMRRWPALSASPMSWPAPKVVVLAAEKPGRLCCRPAASASST